MRFFGGFRNFAKRLGVLRFDEPHTKAKPKVHSPRARVFETVEPRIMLSGIGLFDPIEVGAVYIEGDGALRFETVEAQRGVRPWSMATRIGALEDLWRGEVIR